MIHLDAAVFRVLADDCAALPFETSSLDDWRGVANRTKEVIAEAKTTGPKRATLHRAKTRIGRRRADALDPPS